MPSDAPRTYVISLGGSMIYPKSGLDPSYLSRFRELVLRHVAKGSRFVIICGGGAVCRQYQSALKGSSPEAADADLNWLGVHVTRLNGQLLRLLFGASAAPEVVIDPAMLEGRREPVIIGAGGEPGRSTDYNTVLLAEACGADTVLNVSDIRYVYDKDPREFPDAQPIRSLAWPEFRTQFRHKEWAPGMHSPFDPFASAEAERLGLRVIVADGGDLQNLDAVLDGRPFEGTEIHPG